MAVDIKNSITLKGSAKLVCDYLNFGINSILYQRGVYPPETFKADDKFGMSILMSQDENIQTFLKNVLGKLEEWIPTKCVNKISLIIANVKNLEIMERWDFQVEYEEPSSDIKTEQKEVSNKPLKQVQKEIRDVLKQIISTIAILPLLDCQCSFDIHIYTNKDLTVPELWNETNPALIANSQTVQLRSFATGIHNMHTFVTYKNDI